MLSDKFTLIELFDLSLRVPEVGAVNFNILHTALTHIVMTLGMEQQKPQCYIQDETAAQLAFTKESLSHPTIKKREGIRSTTDAQGIQDRAKDVLKSLDVKDQTESGQEVKSEEKDQSESGQEQKSIRVKVEQGEKDQSKGGQEVKSEKKDLPESGQEVKSKEKDQPESGQEVKSKEKDQPESEQEVKSEEKDQSESRQEVKSEKKDQSENGQEVKSEEKDQPESGQEVKSDRMKVEQEEKPSDGKDAKGITYDKKQKSTEELKDASEPKMEGQDPVMGVQDLWRAININRRTDGLERGLHELAVIVDMIAGKLKDLETETVETTDRTNKLVEEFDNSAEKIHKLEEDTSVLTKSIDDSNEQGKNEIQKVEIALKEDFSKMKEDLSTNVKDINKTIKETQDSITSREDFSELVSRVDILEEVKVNREELGRLMEEGFIEKFIKEQESLRTDLEALNLGVTEVDDSVKALSKRIDEEILQYIDDSLEEINVTIETMKEKLDRLDADDINDTFARLEDQAEKITKDLETLEAEESRLEKEARVNFKKISDLGYSLSKLETSKVDKSKMYELLELKADLEMVMNKLDRTEFVSVMQDAEEKVESLTSKGETTEKNLEEGLASLKRALSFKMYSEDFVVATEPIRNRIKAMMYEQDKIKEMVLTRFLPDAPGVTKCFSCRRAANLTDGRKFQRKYKSPPPSESVDATSKASQKKSEGIRFPPIDLNSVPIPPADKPRMQDIHKLPVLFATARPQVGLAHQKRRRDIDRELSEYFGSEKDFKSIGGAHTQTFPQQRGLSFKTKTLTAEQRYEVLLEGLDKRIYRGSIPKNAQSDLPNDDEEDNPKGGGNNSSEQRAENMVYPTPVILHGRSGPVPSKYVVSLPKD